MIAGVVKSRIIDLSQAAAARLGMMDGTVAPVALEVMETETPPVDPQNSFSVTSPRRGDRVRASPPNRILPWLLSSTHGAPCRSLGGVALVFRRRGKRRPGVLRGPSPVGRRSLPTGRG